MLTDLKLSFENSGGIKDNLELRNRETLRKKFAISHKFIGIGTMFMDKLLVQIEKIKKSYEDWLNK